jgi:peroxiredoxin
MFETSEGISVDEMTNKTPVMMVFLRHFGCTFCREAMQDISSQRSLIEKKGTRILIVHMLEDEDTALEQLQKFGLHNIPTLSDPEKLLYKKFQLRHGSLFQLFGLKVIFRGVIKGLFGGLGIGKSMGDPFQMPGIFLVYKGIVVKQFIHSSAADRPVYTQLAECENCM